MPTVSFLSIHESSTMTSRKNEVVNQTSELELGISGEEVGNRTLSRATSLLRTLYRIGGCYLSLLVDSSRSVIHESKGVISLAHQNTENIPTFGSCNGLRTQRLTSALAQMEGIFIQTHLFVLHHFPNGKSFSGRNKNPVRKNSKRSRDLYVILANCP